MSVYCDIVSSYNIGYISGPMSAKNPISVVATYGYTPILHRYRCNIGPDIDFFTDIGENTHDIGGGNLRVYTDIHRYRCHIGADVGVILTISCTKMPISGHALFFVPISCSQFWYTEIQVGVPISPAGHSTIRYRVTFYPISDMISCINRISAPITFCFVRCSFQGPSQ